MSFTTRQLLKPAAMAIPPIEERLFEHVIGKDCPLNDLLQKGTLSSDWATTYLELLTEAKQTCLHQTHWPRQLVAAIHMASWILDSRYRAWSGSEQGKRNSKTEDLLATMISQSHFFLNAPALERGLLGGQIRGPGQWARNASLTWILFNPSGRRDF